MLYTKLVAVIGVALLVAISSVACSVKRTVDDESYEYKVEKPQVR